MEVTDSIACLPRSLSNADQRLFRHLREHKRLRRSFIALAVGHPAILDTTEDLRMSEICAETGFLPHDLCCLQLKTTVRAISAVAVPARIWFRPGKMSRLVEAKHAARERGLACILVPEGVIRQQPRLRNCEAIMKSGELCVTDTDRIHVIRRIVDAGPSSLVECAQFVRHENPIDAILSMVLAKDLSIDVDAPLMPYSLVDLADNGR